jgi:hypothetical protein
VKSNENSDRVNKEQAYELMVKVNEWKKMQLVTPL